MTKIMFVCHGNICRSPMAEFVMKELVKEQGRENEFYINSSATSREEIGNPVHPGTKKKLAEHNISAAGKCSVQFKKSDYKNYDYIIGMEQYNIKNILKIIGTDEEGKVSRLLDFTEQPGDIDDPWYTGDFESTYQSVLKGCQALLQHLESSI